MPAPDLQENCGHRGREGDPLYRARRTLHTGTDLLTEKQAQRLRNLFAGDQHVEVEATWGVYQPMISAYREPDRAQAKEMMQRLIDTSQSGRPRGPDRGHHPRADLEETGW